MKNNYLFVLLCYCVLLNTACVNEIETEVQESEIPITFSVEIKESATKVSDNAFDSGDQIGLYAMLTGNSVSGERYIDNLLLTCDKANTLIPERNVFYPEGDNTLDFIAYFPYQPERVQTGSAIIPVKVQTDQSNAENFSASDFMTSSKKRVGRSEEAVSLEFNHILTKLKICLTPGSNTSAEAMLQDNPRIIATGFHTSANYNIETEKFTDLEAASDVTPTGTWREEDGKLVGKEFIFIPQTIDNKQAFQMEWNGRIYTCPMPDIEQLDGNTQYDLEINTEESESQLLNGIVASINKWQTGDKLQNVENENGTQVLHLAVLSFEPSNVYRVHLNGKEIGEICKEYLLSSELKSTAITYYPLLEDGTADITQGTILQLLDTEKDINGGTLYWDKSDNTFGYEKGDLSPIPKIYFEQNGTLCLEEPDEPAKVNVIANTLIDTRDILNIQHYPIVKIGTQYWTRENLKAKQYADGTEMQELDYLNGTPGYHEYNGDYFYSGEILEAGTISPEGWGIPSPNEWKALDKYINKDVSLLKAGEWEILQPNQADDVAPVSNKAMMYIIPLGIWTKNTGTEKVINENKMVAFWSWDDEMNRIPEETVFFIGEDNSMVKESTISSGKDFYKGLSIRLIKK